MSNVEIEGWIAAYQSRLERLLQSLLGSFEDARDAAQETWLAVWRGTGRLQAFRDPWPYIRRAAVRKAIDRLRARRTTEVLSDVPAHAADGAHADVEAALLRLDAEERATLVLYFWEGLAVKEIARTLDCPEGTVKTWMHRGRERLKDILGRKD